MNKIALGRGLDALFQQVVATPNMATTSANPVASPASTSLNASPTAVIGTENLSTLSGQHQIRQISVNVIHPNRLQPRHHFNPEKIAELAQSIRNDGLLQPILVTPHDGGYMLVAGERRLRAAKAAGLTTVPCTVTPPLDDNRLLQLALIENIQREDLNAIETAQAYRQLLEKFGFSQTELAEKVGKSRPAISNTLRLLTLPQEVQALVNDGKLSEGHARALLSLATAQEQITTARRLAEGSFSVRDAENATRHTRKRRLIPKRKDINLQEAESLLKRIFAAAVRIKPGLKHGVVEIEYYGVEDLNRILELCQSVKQAGPTDRLSF